MVAVSQPKFKLPWFKSSRTASATNCSHPAALPHSGRLTVGQESWALTDALLQEEGQAVAAIDTAVELMSVCELRELFPETDTEDITEALRQCGGDVNIAAEYLARERSTDRDGNVALWRHHLLTSKGSPLRCEELIEVVADSFGSLVSRAKIEKFVLQTWSSFGLEDSAALTVQDFLALVGCATVSQLGGTTAGSGAILAQCPKLQVTEADAVDEPATVGRTLLTSPKVAPLDLDIGKGSARTKDSGGASEDRNGGQPKGREGDGAGRGPDPMPAAPEAASKGNREGAALAQPAPEREGKGSGKGAAPMPPAPGGKGKGKAKGPGPKPPAVDVATDQDGVVGGAVVDTSSKAPEPAPCGHPAAGGKGGKAKGPGPPPAGKGKAPIAAAPAAEAQGSSPSSEPAAPCPSASPAKGTEQALAAAPPAGKGKGPAGPPAPAGKGKAGGKGAPPPGAGKGGKGYPAAAAPTRGEKDDWVCRSKNNLRWQRRLSGHGGIETSVFNAGEEAIDLAAFAVMFAAEPLPDAGRLSRAAPAPASEKVDKPVLWDPTEKQDAKKRRTNIGILMKTWEKLAEPFLDRLKLLEFGAILSDSAFNEDLFEQLIEMVKGIGSAEWTRLRAEDAESKYEWDRKLEGFFKRLQAISCFKERLMSLHRHVMVERDLRKLEKRATSLNDGILAIQQSGALRVVLRKLLRIGNCLNAGSGNLGRADGFDTVHLLERTLLIDMPKASDGKTSLLQYVRDWELDSAEREGFGELEKRLMGWKVPSGKEDEADATDLNELQKDAGVVSEQLSLFERDLDQIQRELESAGLRPSDQPQLGKQLEVLSCYLDAIQERRRRMEQLRLNDIRERLLELQRYLLHSPPEKKKLSAGKILGVMAQLAQKLAPDKEACRPREACCGAPRSSSLAPPESPRRSMRAPSRRRCTSVDSALPAADDVSREPARRRLPRLAPFRPFPFRLSAD